MLAVRAPGAFGERIVMALELQQQSPAAGGALLLWRFCARRPHLNIMWKQPQPCVKEQILARSLLALP